MTTALSPSAKQQFFTAGGVPLVGGKLYTYAAGTSTPLATYTDSSGTTSNTNPIILDSRGEAEIWLLPATAYKYVLKDSTDTTIWSVDNIDLGINFSNVIITGGTINGVTIGNITPGSGAFTDLSASGSVVFDGTGEMVIPSGLTTDRTPTPSDGMIRYDTTVNKYEGNTTMSGATILTLTHLGTTATLTTSTPHGLATDDYITISGVTPSNYNSSYKITVTGPTTFTYVMGTDPGADASVLGSYVLHAWVQFTGQNSSTGAAFLPAGTTADRPAHAASGYFRFNSSLTRFEGYNGMNWGSVGGATGGGTDAIFYENGQTVTADYTITTGQNAMSTGPITINTGVTVTVPTGSNWVIL